ncbi:hypothetical protein ACWEVP_02560 [Amycolatopsis sp. NPDC003865]
MLKHTGLDNVTFLDADHVAFVEDAGDGLHTQRGLLDSAYLFDLHADYAHGAQPVRFLAEGRDGDNEITGIHATTGDPSPQGILGAQRPTPFAGGWRLFGTQQHGDNVLWEITRRQAPRLRSPEAGRLPVFVDPRMSRFGVRGTVAAFQRRSGSRVGGVVHRRCSGPRAVQDRSAFGPRPCRPGRPTHTMTSGHRPTTVRTRANEAGANMSWTGRFSALAGASALAVATAVAASPPADAEPAVNAGNYTCTWTIDLRPLDTTFHTRHVNVPVRCNGTMSSITIGVWGLSPNGFVNWTGSESCSASATCSDPDLGDPRGGWESDQFDRWIKACITVITPKGATASECNTRVAS